MSEKTYHMFPSFSKLEGMFVVISLRYDGNMKVYRSVGPYTENDNNGSEGVTHKTAYINPIYNEEFQRDEIIDKKAVANRGWFLSGLGIEHDRVVSVKSIHGDNIEIVSESDGGKFIDSTDGLITAGDPGLFLSVTVADCIPVVIFEPNQKLICLLHCGWKGLAKGIIYKALSKIKDNFSFGQECISHSFYAGVGPGIGFCHFEVKKDILPFFSDYQDAIFSLHNENIPKSHDNEKDFGDEILKPGTAPLTGKERYFIDLKLIAKKQLQSCGISPENIEINPECTYCRSDIFFSFRKDKKKPVDAMMVVAGWKI